MNGIALICGLDPAAIKGAQDRGLCVLASVGAAEKAGIAADAGATLL